jgi:hypothetical protein
MQTNNAAGKTYNEHLFFLERKRCQIVYKWNEITNRSIILDLNSKYTIVYNARPK